ncbi:MAG: SusF/SusE family outer membrane protein [Prevotellaceae bacterium]|nr:SusF/SusE family outer membrane protein [Prevotellaceae bacterium]
MKKIFNICIAGLVSMLCLTACSDDNDSNPTLNEGDGSFVLNVPTYAQNNVVDLKNSSTINLTTSQPNYGGVPYATIYKAFVSLDETNWSELGTTFTNTNIAIPAKEMNNAILDLAGDEPDFSAPIAVFVKLKANITATNTDTLGRAESNTVKIPQVMAYVPDANAELPETMYMTGSFPAGNGWGTWVQFAPVYDKAGMFYLMVYLPTDSEFKINKDNAWKGNEKGYNSGVNVVDDAGLTMGSSSDGNFKVGVGGWYTLFVKTEITKGEVVYNLYIEKPNVYIFGACEGGNWAYLDEWKFTVPADENGEFESPALVAGGEVRIALQLPSIDWWRTELTLKDGTTIYYRNENIANNWQSDKGAEYSIQANANQKVYLNFTTGTGRLE